MTIIHLLHQVLGNSTKQKDEYLFNCPFCSSSKKKLSVNLLNNKWQCWVCGSKGSHIIWLLKKLNLTTEQIHTAKELLNDIDIKKFKQTTAATILQLPQEYRPLWKEYDGYIYKHAISYLKKRNISNKEIIRYRIGYCESGTYANCIIIPSYDANNQLNYFVARSFFEGSIRYKNPPISKNVVVFENLIDYSEPLILVEGMFDAITLKQNAIPILGKILPKNLEKKILENNVKNIIIFLDEDALGESMKLETRLKNYGINTKIVSTKGKDANQMGFNQSWEEIKLARSTNFKDLIQHKLTHI